MNPYAIAAGDWRKPGVSVEPGGVNFCLFSRSAQRLELLLFESAAQATPCQVVVLDPARHRTFFFWHVFVAWLPEGSGYCWRADGPSEAEAPGARFDPEKALLDPRAVCVDDSRWERSRAQLPGDNVAHAMRAVVMADHYDWEEDRPLHIPLNDSVIYELHVGGFSRHPSAGVTHPGTFSAVVEKIPYLQALGITHVELMPVMAFDPQDVPPSTAERGLENYWGYSTHSFYAPHPGYAVHPGRARDEFRDMVKALHRAGIAVILDVVFNHTAEGGADGPLIHFKGLDNAIAYHLDPADSSRYLDFTGCGNTVKANHPWMTHFLIDSLQYWVRDMHVDGFRFDLASALARGEDGQQQYTSPFLWATELSPTLRDAHLIAEAWDAAGLYQVGDFPGFRWAEWNGRYRDVLRGFVRGDGGLTAETASRLDGSSDLYEDDGRLPGNSINFITCHDGFTLLDLVSYSARHNEANGEGNRDGHDDNISWNCGVEGNTDDPAIRALRERQARNFIAVLLLSQGVPMLLFGDEVLRSQGGNNNSYCQNNATGWLDWGLLERHRPMFAYTAAMIRFRLRHPSLRRRRFLTGNAPEGRSRPDIQWHGTMLGQPHWEDTQGRRLAFTLAGLEPGQPALHVMLNMAGDEAQFELPRILGQHWRRAVDTDQAPWVFDVEREAGYRCPRRRVAGRSVVVLESRPMAGAWGAAADNPPGPGRED